MPIKALPGARLPKGPDYMRERSEAWASKTRGAYDVRDLDLDGDTLREECGVFGIFGHPDASAITALGLHALQHRGQEAAGIVSFDGRVFHLERKLGLVGDGFSDRCAAEASDRVFATKGLARYLDERGIPYDRFDDFHDVARGLAS